MYNHECDYKLLHFSNANRFYLSLSQTIFLPELTMSSMADHLYEMGTAYPSRVPGFTPFFEKFHVARHLSFLCCYFLGFVQCLVPNFTYVS